MKLEPIIQSKVSQKRKAPIQYVNTHIWNLERWQFITVNDGKSPYIRDSKRDTDIKNRLLDSWTLWEKARVG